MHCHLVPWLIEGLSHLFYIKSGQVVACFFVAHLLYISVQECLAVLGLACIDFGIKHRSTATCLQHHPQEPAAPMRLRLKSTRRQWTAASTRGEWLLRRSWIDSKKQLWTPPMIYSLWQKNTSESGSGREWPCTVELCWLRGVTLYAAKINFYA